MIILELNIDGKIVKINSKGCDILGYEEKEIVGKVFISNFIPDENIENLTAKFSELVKSKKDEYSVDTYKNSIITKHGIIEVIWHNIIQYDESGTISKILSIGDNLTEKNRLLNELQNEYDINQATNTILQMFFKKQPIEAILEQTLEVLINIPPFTPDSKACIFVVDKNHPSTLILKTQKNFPKEIYSTCKEVEFGKCLCGKSALLRKEIIKTKPDNDHDLVCPYASVKEHFCIPIISDNRIFGVMACYFEKIIEHKKMEILVKTIVNSLAIILKKEEDETILEEYKINMETKIYELEKFQKMMVDREIKMIEMKNRINEFEKILEKK